MLKRTIYIGNPAYLKTKNKQLVISDPNKGKEDAYVPIEDVAILLIDHAQVTMTSGLMTRLAEANAVVITCDSRHMPVVLCYPTEGHTEQMKRFIEQINMSEPLKKNLWKQVVEQKILNQATLLETVTTDYHPLYKMAGAVRSGDTTNQEAIAAAYYWGRLFDRELDFRRERMGDPPNHFLNYGYAILRSLTTRALVITGLIPSLGIHHRNKYNAYCLADDMMEPYRPFVDEMVLDLIEEGLLDSPLDKRIKRELLRLPIRDVCINRKMRPLLNALKITMTSLYQCISGERRTLLLPYYDDI